MPQPPSSHKDAIARALRAVQAEGSRFLDGGDAGASGTLVTLARALVTTAETPAETLLWNVWAQSTRNAAGLDLFATACADEGRVKTAAELALAAPIQGGGAPASPKLVRRIARVCVSMEMLAEEGPGLYVPNGHLRDAMAPGHSRLLINECVVVEEGAAWQHASLDLIMMCWAAGQERTEGEWRALIEGCGLKIVGIYNKGEGNEGLIEVVV